MKHTIHFIIATFLVSTIAVYAQFEGLTVATAESAVARLDLRDGFGGRVVQGVVALSAAEGTVKCDGKAISSSWNTTALVDGWHTLSCNGKTERVCVRNDASIRLEEGRIMDRSTWDNDVVHVVRNDVYVPNGVTLSISEGAIVKFAEDSRIIVEHGGKIAVNGGENLPIEFAQVADDSVGGNTDWQDAEVVNETEPRIKCYEDEGWTDNSWFAVNHIVIGALPYLAVQPVRAMRQSGSVRIPVMVSGSRSTSFAVDWQTVDGTAKYGVDFTENSGRVSWTSTSAGVRYIEIPLVTESQTDEDVTFTIRLVRSYGANIQTAEALVTIYNNADSEFDHLTAATATSQPVRLDLRDDFGGCIAQGVMAMSDTDGDVTLNGKVIGESWDTTTLEDGWLELSQGGETRDVAVLNTDDVHCEEGRLTENTTWDNSAVRLIRNDVYIPNGVTLIITEGTTVKFTEDTRIIVENGGKLQINGLEDAFVQFSMATDDGYAGDTDMREAEVVFPANALIFNYSSGTVADNGYVASRGLVISSTYPSLTLHGTAVYEDCGTAYLPVTVSGSRNSTFYAEWTATDGTATFKEDYGLAAGKLTWSSTNNGTKYIAIPIMGGNLAADEETFTVHLVASGGANIVTNDVTVTICKMADTGMKELVHATVVSNAARLDLRDGFGGRIVRGTIDLSTTEEKVSLDGKELPASWNSTASEDGWHELSQNSQTAEICVLNDNGVALEEGRLTENTTWDSTVVHLIRNDVYVPNGVTLTMTSGAVVKFTEDTRIIVEHGGKVSVQGTSESPVLFALATDDAFGGDTDMRDGTMDAPSDWLIYCYNTSTGWTDNGFMNVRQVTFSTLPTVSIHNSRVIEHQGFVAIPVTVSGTRKATFSVDWQATDGTAKLNSDYTLSSGRLSWTTTDNGTRYIEIPIVSDAIVEELEDFTVVLTASSGTNIDVAESTVSIFESAATLPADAEYACTTVETEEGAEVDERTDLFSRLARDVETLCFSTAWAGKATATSVRISVQLDEDNEVPQTIHATTDGDTDGTAKWETYNLGTGRYLLAHETLDNRGGLLDRLETTFFINREVIIHDGRLTGDETWDDSAIHVVRGNVIVPAGVMLTISDGAIVKFQSGCGIIAKLGSVVECNGVTFTHIADDSIGGDTNLDGFASMPSYDAYTLGGDGAVRMDSACKLYCKSATLPSGNLTKNTTLSGNLVYKATGNLTIANGVTLTIEPGAVLKFSSGQGITVNSGATLEAIGTRAQPIVFTSIKDDEHGGDTNQDGNGTVPEEGDWIGITVNGGDAVFNNAILQWGGWGQYSNQRDAILRCNSGYLNLNGCIVQNSLLRLIYAAGNVEIDNSILQQARFGVQGNARITNSVLAFCSDYTLDGDGLLNNSILYETASSNGYSSNYSCFWNAGILNGDGNITDNPLFNDAENGDFTLKPNSPCIDAGDGTVAPELDYWGKPRMNCTKINDTGIASENGCVPDIGIYEYPGTGGGEVPDLKVNWVSGSSIGISGETITVSYQIENVGSVSFQGYWQDSISLCSADEELGQQTVELGDIAGYEHLAVGEKKTIIRQCRIPAIMPGKWRLAVTVNSNLDIYERMFQNNRIEGEDVIEVQVEEWKNKKIYALGSGENIALKAGDHEFLELVSQFKDVLDWQCGVGFIPTETHSDATGRSLNDGRVIMVMPSAADKTAYIRIANDSLTGASFSINSINVAEAVCDVTPNVVSNSEIVTISFVLLDAASVKSVCLKNANEKIQAVGISTDDEGRTVASFNLSDKEANDYDLKVTTSNENVYIANKAVTIVEAVRRANLEAWLDVPDSVREGRQYIGYIRYKNTGNADMNAPVFRVIGENGTQLKVKISDEESDVLLLYGAGSSPVNVLKAGEECKVPFYFSFTGSCRLKFDTMKFPEEEYPVSKTFTTWKELEKAVHKAALRLAARGKEEMDFKVLQNFAECTAVSSFSAISGYVYHAKSLAAIPKATIRATTVDENATEITVETDENGYFCFDTLTGETEYLLTLAFAETVGECKISTVAGQDVNGVELLCIPLGSIDGYVCMKNGQPITENYSVELWMEDGVQALSIVDVSENGKFEFHNLSENTYYLKVSNVDMAIIHKSGPISVDVNNNHHSALLYISQPGCLEGIITTKNGEMTDCEGLTVTAYCQEERYETKVNEDGSWQFTELPAGKYSLEVFGEKWQSEEFTLVELDEGEWQENVELLIVHKKVFMPFPSQGSGPLEVTCYFSFDKSTDGYAFAWDFDGDGVTDSEEPEPQWIYSVLGEHRIDLTLTTPEGNTIQEQQIVNVIKPIENVLRDDVILLHETENPPYEFVSWDGTILVMREVGEYPVKLVKDAKMLFKYPDGDVIAVKILASRKVGDYYYLTVDDAVLTDLFKSFSIRVKDDGIMGTRGENKWEAIKKRIAGSEGFTLDITFEKLPYDLKIEYDENEEIKSFEYEDGYKIEETFSWNGSLSVDLLPDKIKQKMLKLQDKIEEEIFKIPLDVTVLTPTGPIIIPNEFIIKSYFNGSLSFEAELAFEKTFKQELTWVSSKKRLENGEWEIQEAGLLPKLNCTSNIDSASFNAKLNGGVEMGIKLKLLVCGKSIKDKFEASVADLTGKVGIGISFEASPKKLSVSAGLKLSAVIKLFNFKKEEGILPEVDLSVFTIPLYSGILWGKTWKWGVPMERFSWNAMPYDYSLNSYSVNFNTLGPEQETQVVSKRPLMLGRYEIVYHPADNIDSREWDFGDGKSEIHSGGSPDSFSYVYEGKSSHRVSLLPKRFFMKGVKFTSLVVPSGEKRKCPICGHIFGSYSTTCTCHCHGYYEFPDDDCLPPILQSCDPNEIVGPRGAGDPATQRLVERGEWLDYTVYFENKSTADAAAQEIWVDLDLDEKLVDVSTFQLGAISFGNQLVNTLNGKATGKFTVTQDGTPWQVRGKVTCDKDNGAVQWYLRSYDPANAEGGYWPAVVTAGFLPPNDDNHSGEGYVSFRVKVRDDAPIGRRIDCSATITFDRNQPITTSPAWFNWIYDGATATTETGVMTWDAQDDATYDVTIWKGDADKNSDAAELVTTSDSLTMNRWRLPSILLNDVDYYWQVTTTTADGTVTESPVWGFDLGGRCTLELKPGWNLFSLPFRPENYTERILLGQNLFGIENNSYTRTSSLEGGKAYWLFQHDNTKRYLDIFPSQTRTAEEIPLKAGWNMVGPTDTERHLDSGYTIWYWQDGRFVYLEEDAEGGYTLKAGVGYWIYIMDDGEFPNAVNLEFRPPSGTKFSGEGLQVFLRSNLAHDIVTFYYTLDGSKPTDRSKRYDVANGIWLTSTATIRVAAYVNNRLVRDDFRANYTKLPYTYSIQDGKATITRYTVGNMTEVAIPDKIDGAVVTGIGDHCFAGASSLTSLKLPDSIVSIGEDAFDGCTALTTVESGSRYVHDWMREHMPMVKLTGLLEDDDLYIVVDLSAGPDAANYPVRYTDQAPNLEDDACRTTELWLRKIPAGTFIMGSPEDEVGRRDSDMAQHEVTLTQDYYIGVFECTQKQWELVMGSNPSSINGNSRPVECVSYEMIRGTGEQGGAGWPEYGHSVDATSFMGKLQAKTGLVFDLPTEAQWEYACRAGTTTALNSGKNLTSTGQDANMAEVGRYAYNHLDGKGGYSDGHAKVGSYRQNAWGLYDMHGNVYELCLDWYGASTSSVAAVSDPVGPNTGWIRVQRGGDWARGAELCRSASRSFLTPSDCYHHYGFRIFCQSSGR